jgi:peptide deformylase
MHEDLKIIHYPDPRLKKVSAAVESFDEDLKALAARMFELMRQSRGVGLAAPQVGKNIRLFIMNATGQPGDDRIYVNPELTELSDEEVEAEEGCLSLPEINVMVYRNKTIRLQARDLEGKPIDQTETGYVARIWQHENDHLDGILLTEKMGPVARIASRRILKELEAKYAEEQAKKK